MLEVHPKPHNLLQQSIGWPQYLMLSQQDHPPSSQRLSVVCLQHALLVAYIIASEALGIAAKRGVVPAQATSSCTLFMDVCD